MRHLLSATAAAAVMFTAVFAQDYLTFQGPMAEKLFRLSRQATGGDEAGAKVTSLVMKGISRVSAGDPGPAERAVEIRYLFPDQYVRIETAGAWSKRSGFSGANLLTQIRTGQTIDTPPASMTPALLRGEKGRLARMLLGIATLTTPEVWLTVREPTGSIDPAQNPSAPRVLQVTAKDGFAATIYFDGAGLPLLVEYQANRRFVAIRFSDRRKTGALTAPYTITTTLDNQPLEELKLDEIVVNPPLTAADFIIK